MTDSDWRDLLDEIDAGRVVPVIGSALITVPDEFGIQKPLYTLLAQRLATELGLSEPQTYATTGAAAAAHVLSGRERIPIYRSLRMLLKTIDAQLSASAPDGRYLSPSLSQLARIRGFGLYLGTTPDHHMLTALRAGRPSFDAQRHHVVFHPNEAPAERDLPTAKLRGGDAYLYQLLGDQDAQQCRDFAVWEEDLMEFVCGLLEHADQLKNLFNALKERSLLFLGAPADDWTVRFLLRVVRGERLSSRSRDHIGEYIADDGPELSRSTVLYFDQAVKTTRLVRGNPNDFVAELFSRWQQTFGVEADDRRFLESLPRDMPAGAVFISYANEDLAVALNVARALHAAAVSVWIDRRQLQAGQLYDERLEAAVRLRSSLFIALVSSASESNADRYVHREREWAAQRQGGLTEEFYLPVLVDIASPKDVRLEPQVAMRRHFHNLGDDGLNELARRVGDLHRARGSRT
ncbi:toll/interleukin-1 receptor domain-containing protein [Undibacterium sp. CY18W]|uniref:Toll/interleukin-1 receptor domain-containing protein n=1 Tax=Undibacterium hunanense TaxID=2762292 RepID=A0ABR6ZSL0_9BURK|nr:toll/interleukin-1 receptor domain-containing protein [Undibacterium hunanense]MBC3918860.1 toll/interleukin-1 receptor domain-containing protein [Undibacterium hunanense]